MRKKYDKKLRTAMEQILCYDKNEMRARVRILIANQIEKDCIPEASGWFATEANTIMEKHNKPAYTYNEALAILEEIAAKLQDTSNMLRHPVSESMLKKGE